MVVDLTRQVSENRIKQKAALAKEGLALRPKPVFRLPRLPMNITELDDRDLMNLFTRFVRYQDHISGLLACSEIDEQSAEHLLELERAKYLVNSWNKSPDSVNVAKAEALVNPAVQELVREYERCKAKRKLYAVMADTLYRDAALISREVSRRGAREPFERRVDGRWAS